MKCINCSKPIDGKPAAVVLGLPVCKACDDAARHLEALLKEGITLEYRDGTKRKVQG